MVLPEIHPGPYHPVGGSNIPYLIYKNLSSSAMVMHSISDHALNLPSRNEVDNYLKNLQNFEIKEEGMKCTEPVVVQINKARVTGMLLGNNPLLFFKINESKHDFAAFNMSSPSSFDISSPIAL